MSCPSHAGDNELPGQISYFSRVRLNMQVASFRAPAMGGTRHARRQVLKLWVQVSRKSDIGDAKTWGL